MFQESSTQIQPPTRHQQALSAFSVRKVRFILPLGLFTMHCEPQQRSQRSKASPRFGPQLGRIAYTASHIGWFPFGLPCKPRPKEKPTNRYAHFPAQIKHGSLGSHPFREIRFGMLRQHIGVFPATAACLSLEWIGQLRTCCLPLT